MFFDYLGNGFEIEWICISNRSHTQAQRCPEIDGQAEDVEKRQHRQQIVHAADIHHVGKGVDVRQ